MTLGLVLSELLPGHALPFVLAGAAFAGATRLLVGCSTEGPAVDKDRCQMQPLKTGRYT